ncbi:MAG: glycine--tRNA ligase subunit beta [Anaerolineales bacterium]|nr:glycine--tRNA ligase subunit beta [Anaerolineales bacterium]
MTKPLDFQSLILTLQHFWADHGCLIWQPYYQQVGAGTLNPATALRVLGPEPWNVGYVEPSIRPDDGRYGENPNRMQMHYQFQVILKPDPGNPQELYLLSLEALGIDPRQHDIRFVEDNWESPALGAWGLGWEVWLDGQEITQFTYFQQAGGQPTNPVSVEITYGLDRIAIALQRVHGFTEIRWNDALTCGDVNLQAEQEQSTYYFNVADVERLRQMYDLFEKEADACLAKNLVLPAHDYILRCSHTFNVLDARGAIGLTERQAYFGRMRELSRRVADAYLEQRQRLEYPWLKEEQASTTAAVAQPAPERPQLGLQPFLLEIGTEELPSGDLESALEQLRARLPALLADLRLEHGEVRALGTPRRLVAFVADLSPHQPDLEQVVKGPPAARAYDALGQPTPAAEGFARSKGLSVGDLQVREIDGGQYVTAVVRQAGRPAAQVLGEALPGLIAALRFDKSMRWNSTNVAFSRPLRWLLALVGEQVVPFGYAGLQSSNRTRGLRFTQAEEIVVPAAGEYFRCMAEQGILLDQQERRQSILAQVRSLAAEVGGYALEDPALLAEVANLVEAPAALRGAFDPQHLALPRDVLITVMKKHQRYIPVFKSAEQTELLPYFITVANKPLVKPGVCEGTELITEGNEHVVRARFADADFFVRDDRKHRLEDFLPRLGTLIFQTRLGSMLDKTQRISALVDWLSAALASSPDEVATARRAAQLCKADLATHMVVEMTSLQGVMGRHYALASDETQAVADAIFEHYLPRYAGDAMPQSRPGLLVGLADRLDTLSGLFAAGLAPTGARDPFAQRRAALGLVQALMALDVDFDLRPALDAAAANLPIPISPENKAACLTFIIERLRNLLLESGRRFDVVDAVVAAQGHNPALAARAVTALEAWVARPDWHTILPAYARCVRITRDQAERFTVNEAVFVEQAERALYAVLLQAEASPRQPGAVDDFLNAFVPMIPAVNLFFDEVLVMTEDLVQQGNRLGLLQRIAALAAGVMDASRLEGF